MNLFGLPPKDSNFGILPVNYSDSDILLFFPIWPSQIPDLAKFLSGLQHIHKHTFYLMTIVFFFLCQFSRTRFFNLFFLHRWFVDKFWHYHPFIHLRSAIFNLVVVMLDLKLEFIEAMSKRTIT